LSKKFETSLPRFFEILSKFLTNYIFWGCAFTPETPAFAPLVLINLLTHNLAIFLNTNGNRVSFECGNNVYTI